MIVFVALTSVIWALAHVYVGRRLLPAFFGDAARQRWAVRLLWLEWAIGPLTLLATPLTGDALFDAFQRFGYLVIGLFSIVFALVVVRDALLGAFSLVDRVASRGAAPDFARRELLGRMTASVALGASGLLTAVGYARALRTATVETIELRIPGLSPGLEGFRIAQISDVHVGPFVREDEVRTIVAAVNALSPDLVAITGDLVDGSVERIGAAVAPLGELRSTHGSYFCTGNHEFYAGAAPWCAEVSRLGVRVLSEAHALIEHGGAKLLVGGVHDPEGERFGTGKPNPRAAIDGAPPHDYAVLLAHRPNVVRDAAAAGFDLQLSGHTHGGQYFPYTFLVRMVQPFRTGLHRVGGTFLYVNRGTTFWGPPLRLGSPQEITLLTLRRASR